MQVYLVIVSSVGYPSAGPDLYFKTLLQKFSDVYMEWYSEPLYIPHSASPVVPAWPSLFPVYLHSLPLKYFQGNASILSVTILACVSKRLY